jgi:hypothetical protein
LAAVKIEAATLCHSCLPSSDGTLSILGAGLRSYRKVTGDSYCHLFLAGVLLHEDGDPSTPGVSTSVALPNGEMMTLIDRAPWNLGATAAEPSPRRYPISTPVHFPAADAGVYTITLSVDSVTVTLPVLVTS